MALGYNPSVSDLPLRTPDRTCNARLHRSSGYCQNAAGAGTDHPGVGRCRLHGGLSPRHEGADGPLDLFRAHGLGQIIDLAETMTHDDQEYLVEVGNNALVVARASILARITQGRLEPQELSHLTMALSRIDKLIERYPNEENPDAAPNQPGDGLEEELARLEELENL